MVFTTERFLEVAIENQREWDLSPQPLNSVEGKEETKERNNYILKEKLIQLVQGKNYLYFYSENISATAFINS